MSEQKKLCPMMFNQDKRDADMGDYECEGKRCAWWTGVDCAVSAIVWKMRHLEDLLKKEKLT